jgi:hypothetical protein
MSNPHINVVINVVTTEELCSFAPKFESYVANAIRLRSFPSQVLG